MRHADASPRLATEPHPGIRSFAPADSFYPVPRHHLAVSPPLYDAT